MKKTRLVFVTLMLLNVGFLFSAYPPGDGYGHMVPYQHHGYYSTGYGQGGQMVPYPQQAGYYAPPGGAYYQSPVPLLPALPMPAAQTLPDPRLNPLVPDGTRFTAVDGKIHLPGGLVLDLHRPENPIANAVTEALGKYPCLGWCAGLRAGPLETLRIEQLGELYPTLLIYRYLQEPSGSISVITGTQSIMRLSTPPAEVAAKLKAQAPQWLGWWGETFNQYFRVLKEPGVPALTASEEARRTPSPGTVIISQTPREGHSVDSGTAMSGDVVVPTPEQEKEAPEPDELTQLLLRRLRDATRNQPTARELEAKQKKAAALREAEEARTAAAAAQLAIEEQRRQTQALAARLAALEQNASGSPDSVTTPPQTVPAKRQSKSQKKKAARKAREAANADEKRRADVQRAKDEEEKQAAKLQAAREAEIEEKRKAALKAQQAEKEKQCQQKAEDARLAFVQESNKAQAEVEAKKRREQLDALEFKEQQRRQNRKFEGEKQKQEEAENARRAQEGRRREAENIQRQKTEAAALKEKKKKEKEERRKKEEAEEAELARAMEQRKSAETSGSVTQVQTRAKDKKGKKDPRLAEALKKRAALVNEAANKKRSGKTSIRTGGELVTQSQLNGLNLLAEGKPAEAVAPLQQALREGAFNANLSLFQALYRSGQKDEATELMKELRQKIADFDPVRQTLVLIEDAYAKINDLTDPERKVNVDVEDILELEELIRKRDETEADYVKMELMHTGHHPDYPKSSLCTKQEAHEDSECTHSIMCKLASQSSAPGALRYVGICLTAGLGRLDTSEGIRKLKKAAKTNDLKALCYLGEYYHNQGKIEEAFNYLDKATKGGSAEAEKLLMMLCIQNPGDDLERLKYLDTVMRGKTSCATEDELERTCQAAINMLSTTAQHVENIVANNAVERHEGTLASWCTLATFVITNRAPEEGSEEWNIIEQAKNIIVNIKKQKPDIIPGAHDPTDAPLSAIRKKIAPEDFYRMTIAQLETAGKALWLKARDTTEFPEFQSTINDTIAIFDHLAKRDHRHYIMLNDCMLALADRYEANGYSELAKLERNLVMTNLQKLRKHLAEIKKGHKECNIGPLDGMATGQEVMLLVHDAHPDSANLSACGGDNCKHFRIDQLLKPFIKNKQIHTAAAFVYAHMLKQKENDACKFPFDPEKAIEMLESYPAGDPLIQTALAEAYLGNPTTPERKARGFFLLQDVVEKHDNDAARQKLLRYYCLEENIRDAANYDRLAELITLWHYLHQKPSSEKVLQDSLHILGQQGVIAGFLEVINKKTRDLVQRTKEQEVADVNQKELIYAVQLSQKYVEAFATQITPTLTKQLEAMISEVESLPAALQTTSLQQAQKNVLAALCQVNLTGIFTILCHQVDKGLPILIPTPSTKDVELLKLVTAAENLEPQDLANSVDFTFKLLNTADLFDHQQIQFEKASSALAIAQALAEANTPLSEVDQSKINAITALFENRFFRLLRQVTNTNFKDPEQSIPVRGLSVLFDSMERLPEVARIEAEKTLREYATLAFKAYEEKGHNITFQNHMAQRQLGLMALNNEADREEFLQHKIGRSEPAFDPKLHIIPKVGLPSFDPDNTKNNIHHLREAARILDMVVRNEESQEKPYCQIACASVAAGLPDLCRQFTVDHELLNASEKQLHFETLTGLLSACLCITTPAQTAADVVEQTFSLAAILRSSQEIQNAEDLIMKEVLKIFMLLTVRDYHEQNKGMPASGGTMSWKEAAVKIQTLATKDKKTANFLEVFRKSVDEGQELKVRLALETGINSPNALLDNPARLLFTNTSLETLYDE